MQCVFALLDTVFHIPPAVIDLDHLAGREPGVGEHKADPGEHLTTASLDLGHYPPRPTPTLGLVVEINIFDLNAALGRSAHRSVYVRF